MNSAGILMCRDTVFEIAKQADYKTTKSLIATYPEFFHDVDVWTEKCQGRPYISTWTAEQNYRVQELCVNARVHNEKDRGPFVLVINLQAMAVDCFLYEDCVLVRHLFEFCNSQTWLLKKSNALLNITVDARYVIFGIDPALGYCHVVAQTNSGDEALAFLNSGKTTATNDYRAVVDLAKLQPVFISNVEFPQLSPGRPVPYDGHNKGW